MKTTISNQTGEVLEVAKQIAYSLEVLAIGLFIPLSFVFGITYKRHDQLSQKQNVIKEASVFQQKVNSSNTASFQLPDQNS